MSILVFIEQHGGSIKRASLEILGKGRELADKVGQKLVAVLIGQGVAGLTDALGEYGADIVHLADEGRFKEYSTALYARVLAELARQEQPSLFLLGATALGKDLAPRVAARLGVALASDATGLEINPAGQLEVRRPMYAGKILATLEGRGALPQLVSVRPRAFPLPTPAAGRRAEVKSLTTTFEEKDLRQTLKEVLRSVQGMVDLTEADIIVSGGHGIKAAENFALLEELAGLLGAAVGASRAAVDAGFAPYSRQVGQTGKVVSPMVYIACGISGAMQHLAGMSSSKFIVAINKDPDAPIFKVADFGIVGDLFKVVPALIQEIKKERGIA
ncbi:MAG: electron transfer flavoprotein subunit alpha/FixB family protein [Firmicutes bacterium]|nr:electron transfer flavoprotein subunit alpha/FixB family protein [Bacillota bacterium]